jgi:hypothetical protein
MGRLNIPRRTSDCFGWLRTSFKGPFLRCANVVAESANVPSTGSGRRSPTPFGYDIDDHWLTDFWKRLATAKHSVKAQVHTHPGEAFHSATDDKWPIVSQEGFMSIVIPDFATGEISLENAWVGRLGGDGKWRRLGSPEQAIGLA